MSLIIDHVTGGYGHLPVLKDISFNVQPGEIVGLIGLNGAGKSTTIKHIIGLLEPSKGTIEINHLSLKKNTEIIIPPSAKGGCKVFNQLE